MKNLVLLRALEAVVPRPSSAATSAFLAYVAVDSYNGTIYGIWTLDSQPSPTLVAFDPKTNSKQFELSLAENDIIQSSSEVVAAQFVPDLEAVCISTKGGEIILANTKTQEVECVGVIDSGILCMAWSPDNEVVVFVTGSWTLLEMTKDWDIVVETPLPLPQGHTGVPAGSSLPSLSWRGDGAYFACNTATGAPIMIFDRACTAHTKAEPTPCGGTAVTWRPSGELIATSQRIEPQRRHDIIFYERNGLRHGEFALAVGGDPMTVDVVALSWNADSEVLAVVLREQSTAIDKVQLWYRSNYHWYLKHEHRCHGDRVATAAWDAEDPMVLRIVTRQGHVAVLSFCWEYTVSQGRLTSNAVTAAVVDGHTLHLTPLRYCVIPPPMSPTRLVAPAEIVGVSFAPPTTATEPYGVVVKTVDGRILLYRLAFGAAQRSPSPPNYDTPPTLVATVGGAGSGPLPVDVDRLRQVLWVDACRLVAVQHVAGAGYEHIVAIDLTQPATAGGVAAVAGVAVTRTSEPVLRLYQNADTRSIFAETADGTAFRVRVSGDNAAAAIELERHTTFPTACAWIGSAVMGPSEAVIGLTSRGKLFIGQRTVSAEASSFGLHGDYLLFTTLAHTLRFVPLAVGWPDGAPMLESRPAAPHDDSVREVERGSRLVAVVPDDIKVVLQMPRGNLETIYPRALLLTALRRLLDAGQYREAFAAMVRHRVDLNFLYDHHPAAFLSRVDEVVNQIADVNHLNLFLSSLRNDDVTQTTYPPPSYYHRPSQPSEDDTDVPLARKVNAVCDRVRAAVERLDPQKYLPTVLVSYVKKDPPELEEALRLIKRLRNGEAAVVKSTTAGSKAKSAADEALKYVIWLAANVDGVFDTALGMYDFDMAIMVAQKSQKDPKEYLPFIEELRRIDNPAYQRYRVDSHLNRWQRALTHLAAAGDEHFDECLQLIKRHRLYSEAVRLYAANAARLKTLYQAYGEYLLAEGKLAEAALCFLSAGNDEAALEAYKKSLDWRMCLTLARRPGSALRVHFDQHPEEYTKLATDMAVALESHADFRAAAVVRLQYCNDVDAAVTDLLREGQWAEALRIALLRGRDDLIEASVHRAVLEAGDDVLSKIQSNAELYRRHATRLVTVRKNKEAILSTAPSQAGFDADNFSETSSIASDISSASASSRISSTSKKSARSKRRASRRRLSGKEGSPYEEEYLVTQLRELAPTPKYLADIKELLQALMHFGHWDKAAELQRVLHQYIEQVNAASELVQPANAQPSRPLEEDEDEEIAGGAVRTSVVPLVSAPTSWELTLLNQ